MPQTILNKYILDLKHELLKVIKSSFVKNIFVVMSGVAIAQLFSLALLPIISRLFSPADYGIYGSFDAVLMVITSGITLHYAQAIMLPKSKEDAMILFTLSCLSTTVISFLCLTVCIIAPAVMMNLIKAPNAWMLVLLIVSIFISGLHQGCHAWCVRVKEFKITSTSQIISSVSTNSINVGLGYISSGPFALIISGLIGHTLSCINLARIVLRNVRMSFMSTINLHRIKQQAKEYRDFPLYSASQNVINSLSQGLPVLLITHFFGIAAAGAYAFGVRIIMAPMRFVLMPLNQVLFQKASETKNEDRHLFPLYTKITLGLFSLTIIPVTVLIIWSPQIFGFIFGAKWYTAGEYARGLIIWLMFAFCNLPAVLFAKIIRIQQFVFFYDLCLLAARTLSFVLGGLYLGVYSTIMLYAVTSAMMEIFFIIRIGFAVKKEDLKLKRK